MKALRFSSFGNLSDLCIEEVPTPVAGRGQILIQVRAASINPSDAKNVLGRLKSTTLPRIPGRDLAGVVVAGDRDMIGREVWAAGGDIGSTRDGSHAEYILLDREGARPKPKNLSMAEVASVGINYITAYYGLMTKAQLREGETVLVTGVSGGVGSSAAKIAKSKSALLIGVDRRTPEAGQMRRLGIDLGLNSESDDIGGQVREFTQGKGVDVVFDAVGGPLFEIVLNTLGLGGRQVNIVSIGAARVSFDLQDFYHRRLSLYGVDTIALDSIACADILDELRPAFERGELTPPAIARTVSLAESIEAYKIVDSGRAKGKFVITFPG